MDDRKRHRSDPAFSDEKVDQSFADSRESPSSSIQHAVAEVPVFHMLFVASYTNLISSPHLIFFLSLYVADEECSRVADCLHDQLSGKNRGVKYHAGQIILVSLCTLASMCEDFTSMKARSHRVLALY